MEIKLARKRIPVESACGRVEAFEKSGIAWLIESGRVARVVRRKSDGKVTRLLLLALPNEMAHRSPQSTVEQVLPLTYTHRSSLRLGL